MIEQKFPFEHFLGPIDNKEIKFDQIELNNQKELLEEDNKPKQKSTENKNGLSNSELSEVEIDTINQEILFQIKNEIGNQKFNAYFNSVFQLKKIKGPFVEFAVTTAFIKTIIEKNFLKVVHNSLLCVLGKEYELHIIVYSKKNSSINGKISDDLESKNKQHSAKNAKFTIDLIPTPETAFKKVESTINALDKFSPVLLFDAKKTFDTFVVGPSNNMAYASIHAISSNPGKIYPTVYLHGNSGLGKTHLLHAVANKIKLDFPSLRISFITARDFMNEMINFLTQKRIGDFRKKYTEKVDVLLVDDIQELKNKIGTQNEFFHIFNELYVKGKQLIFTSDKPPQEIDGLEERIKTRLSWGLVLDIHAPDLETRIAILKKKVEQEDLFLPDDVIHLIANSIQHNIRELESSLIKLSAYASIMHADIDIETAKRQLKLDEVNNDRGVITIDKIISYLSDYYKIPVVDIKSKVRKKRIIFARHLTMYLAYKLTTQTLNQIGHYFGQKDHSSALHAVEKIKEQIELSSDTELQIIEFEEKLREIC